MDLKKIIVAGTTAAFMLVVFSTVAHADGKKTFLDNKCNKCHEGAGIKLLPKDPAAEDAEVEEGVKKVDPPKLDGLGAELKKEFGGDVAKIKSFLRKQAANSEGRKHKKSVKVDDAVLDEMVKWLLTL